MSSINVDAMIKYALTFQGIPYVYGGYGTSMQCYKWTMGSTCSVHRKGVKYTGYDCSGFVTKVLSKYGINMPRTTAAMQSWNPGSHGKIYGTSTTPKRGDVILYSGHVALAISSTHMVHAGNCGTDICTRTIYSKGMTKIFRFNDSGSSSSGSGSGTTTQPKTIQEQCFEYYVKQGCSTEAACGILGNIKGESNFSTTVVNKTSGATGLCQWLGSRLTNLKNKASSEGKSWSSVDFQLEFSWFEFTGVECRPWMNRWGSVSKFKALKDVEEATLAWEVIFERSGGQGNAKRIQYAKEFYTQFKNYTIGSGSGGGSTTTPVEPINIIGAPTASAAQMKNWAQVSKATTDFVNNAQHFYDYGKKLGVNPVVAYAHYAWETSFGQYKGNYASSTRNTCGIKDSDNKNFATFKSWNEGIEAHIDHLGLNAGGFNYPRSGSPDPRHFTSLYGKYKTFDAFGKMWSGGDEYANHVRGNIAEIEASAGATDDNNTESEGTKPSLVGKKIFLDPGHGGTDSGAVGHGLLEKDVNLSVALKTKKYLEERGATVRMSRETDMAVNLAERPELANSWGADCFLSIHCNSASVTTAQGVETYYYSSANTLASSVQAQILLNHDLYKKDRGVKSENFLVIREAKMMSALVELAFINNAEDAAILRDKQEEFALACAKGIVQYLGCNWDDPDVKPPGWEEGKVGEYDPATKYIGQVYNVGSDSLNVRSGAGTSFSILEKIKLNAKVNVYEVLSNGWLRVKTESGKIGFVSGNYIKKFSDAPGKVEEKYMYYVYTAQSTTKEDAEKALDKIKTLGYTNAKIEARSL